MTTSTWRERRGQIETYFDRTAADAWSRLTSTDPVSGIRATVRAGRDRMRATLLSWLPDDLRGRRILDAGCGTGAFAVEAARRGADVLAIDLSPTLVNLARERMPHDLRHGPGCGRIEFRVGDMTDAGLGRFDHAVAMDSLIHYRAADVTPALASLAMRTSHSILFTFAPRTAPLAAMHMAGRLFPRSDRAPAIEPIAPHRLIAAIEAEAGLAMWHPVATHRVASGFYTSQAMRLERP